MKTRCLTGPQPLEYGFTLVESAIVLAITAMLASTALPAMVRMLARYQLATAQNELVASLQQARYRAVSSGRHALLCPSGDGRQCADSTHWEGGWALGSYRSGQADQLDGPPALVHGGYGRLLIVSSDGRRRVRFHPDGSAGGSMATFTLCRQAHPEEALALTVSITGRVAAAKATAKDAAGCAAAR